MFNKVKELLQEAFEAPTTPNVGKVDIILDTQNTLVIDEENFLEELSTYRAQPIKDDYDDPEPKFNRSGKVYGKAASFNEREMANRK